VRKVRDETSKTCWAFRSRIRPESMFMGGIRKKSMGERAEGGAYLIESGGGESSTRVLLCCQKVTEICGVGV